MIRAPTGQRRKPLSKAVALSPRARGRPLAESSVAPRRYLPSLAVGRIGGTVVVAHRAADAAARNAARFRQRHPEPERITLVAADCDRPESVADLLNDAVEGARRF